MKGGKSKAEAKLSMKKRGTGSEKAGNKPTKKGKLANNPNKPKRPSSAFFVFIRGVELKPRYQGEGTSLLIDRNRQDLPGDVGLDKSTLPLTQSVVQIVRRECEREGQHIRTDIWDF